MAQEERPAVAATHFTPPFPAFTGRPRVFLSTEGQLVFRRPRWHSLLRLGLVLFLLQALAHGLLPFAVAALVCWFCFMRGVTSVAFDRDTRLMTTRHWFLSLKRPSQRSLADVHGVHVLTYPFMFTHQINLIFASSEPSVIGLFSVNNGSHANDLARRLVDFLGVPVFQERFKWI